MCHNYSITFIHFTVIGMYGLSVSSCTLFYSFWLFFHIITNNFIYYYGLSAKIGKCQISFSWYILSYIVTCCLANKFLVLSRRTPFNAISDGSKRCVGRLKKMNMSMSPSTNQAKCVE